MISLEDDYNDDILQAAINVDDDILLATQLSEEEERISQQRLREEEEDFELALKLAEELDGSSSDINFGTVPPSKGNQCSTTHDNLNISFENFDSNIGKNDTNRTNESSTRCNLQVNNQVALVRELNISIEDFDSDFEEDIAKNDGKSHVTFSNFKKKNETKYIDSDYLLAVQLSKLNRTNENVADFDSDFEEKTEPNDTDSDYLLAFQLSQISSPDKTKKAEKNGENVKKYLERRVSVVDSSWETIDPNPDIYSLFIAFNKRFFWGKLDMVEVKWSPRMTLCAGICSYHRRAGHCTVKLSKPLLQFRPRKDLVETLLHEMIHAFLFVTNNDRDRSGHGPQFHSHMYRINKESGANITVYHSFHDEVKFYLTHVWQCDGPCRKKPPYYGLVKRSRNRAPGPYDHWWADHKAACGGNYVKIKEPEDYGKKKTVSTKKEGSLTNEKSLRTNSNIQNYFKTSEPSSSSATSSHVSVPKTNATFTAVNLSTATAVPTKRPLTNNKICTLSDLAKIKRSPTKSPSGSPKKWAPLPGQRNILHFINK